MNTQEFNIKEKVLVIAEIGNNHEGNFDVAKKIVWSAAKCGVGAVKFQTFKTEHYISGDQKERFAKVKSFELSLAQFNELSKLAHSLGMLFISTPFDLGSVIGLEDMVDAYKISSGDNDFYPLLKQVAKTGKPIIVSAGGSNFKRIKSAVDYINKQWIENGIVNGQLVVLHCVSSYPVPLEQANLRSILYLVEQFKDIMVGYSDHTEGSIAALMAVAMGARVIEKHFTLDKKYSDFRDHQLSADPKEMKELVREVGRVELILGKYGKAVQASEKETVKAVRRSIVASRDMPAGYVLVESDLIWVRLVGGLAPGEEKRIVGKSLKRDVLFGQQLLASDVKNEVRLKVVD